MNISVFITSYNQKAYLQEAIDSVLVQTLPPRQIVIVDDCSTDGSQALIKGYRSRYPDLITIILHTQNMGVARSRNDALHAVTGEVVTFLDGDDRYLPAKLEKESALLTGRPEAQIAYSNNYYITAGGRRYDTWITDRQPPQGDVFREVLTRRFPRRNLFRVEMLPYALWQQVGFYDPVLHVLEDWEMRIRLTKKYRVAYLDEPLSEYRIFPAGISETAISLKLSAFDYIWQKHQPLLADMSAAERSVIIERMNQLRAMFIRQQAKDLLGAYGQPPYGSKREAWDYLIESRQFDRSLDWDLIAGILLPSSLYLPLRKTMRSNFGRGDKR